MKSYTIFYYFGLKCFQKHEMNRPDWFVGCPIKCSCVTFLLMKRLTSSRSIIPPCCNYCSNAIGSHPAATPASCFVCVCLQLGVQTPCFYVNSWQVSTVVFILCFGGGGGAAHLFVYVYVCACLVTFQCCCVQVNSLTL